MQTIDKFNSNLSTAILLTGGAGSGKTSLGLRLYPKTYALVIDLNFQSGLDYLKRVNVLDNVVGFDVVSPDENGKPVVPNQRYDRMFKLLNEAIASPSVETVFIDSATFLEDVIKAKICGAIKDNAIKLEGFAQWGTLVLTWKGLITELRQSGKRIIMSAHEVKERDESDQVYKYQIAVDGSIRSKLPALFSDVLRCEVTEQGIGPSVKHVWNVRTLSNIRQEYLKNTFGLPAVLSQDELVKTVKNEEASRRNGK